MLRTNAYDYGLFCRSINYTGPLHERNINAMYAAIKVYLDTVRHWDLKYYIAKSQKTAEEICSEILAFASIEDITRGVLPGEYVPYGNFRNACIKSGIFVNFYPSIDAGWVSATRSVSYLNLQPRITNALQRRGLNTVYDILLLRSKVGASWFRDVPGLGEKSAQAVDLKLSHILEPHGKMLDTADLKASCLHHITTIMSMIDTSKDYGELCVINKSLTEICNKLCSKGDSK